MQLAQAARVDDDMGGGDGLGDGEGGRIGDADLAATGVQRLLGHHVVREAEARLLDPATGGLFELQGGGDTALEDVLLLRGDPVENLGREAEVLRDDGFGDVG